MSRSTTVPRRTRLTAGMLALLALVGMGLSAGQGSAEAASGPGRILAYIGGTNVTNWWEFGMVAGRPVDTTASIADDLSGYKCVLIAPNYYPYFFDSSEKAALTRFVNGGGTLVAMTESSSFYAYSYSTMRDLAQALGAKVEPTFAAATPLLGVTTNIQSSPLTAGVSSVSYASANVISTATANGAGQSLIRTQDGQTIVAVDQIGSGLLIMSGDSSLFQSLGGAPPVNSGNRALVDNLCGGPGSDHTPPTTAATLTPAPNAAGWNNTDVSVKLTATDNPGGFGAFGLLYAWDDRSCTPESVDTCEGVSAQYPVFLTVEWEGVSTVYFFSDDEVGNMEAQQRSQVVKVDKTKPAIAFVSRTPTANANGWNKGDVTVTWSCADDLSGPAAATVTQTVTGEAAALSATGTCADKAGNTASDTQTAIKIDRTAPSVAVTGVTDGGVYTVGSVPVAGCTTSDSLSGVAANATLSVSGGNGSTVGTVTATCSGASDKAGNTAAPVSVTYKVQYKFSGFFAPVDNPPTVNTVKAGSTLPLKWSLNGVTATSTLVSVQWKAIDCGALTGTEDPVAESTTTGGTTFRYDATAGQFIYNLATEAGWAGACKQAVVTLDDGSTHAANFKFK